MNEAAVNYVPATTRAVLARFGGELSVRLGGKDVVLPAHELPGEVEWRVEMLNWYVMRLVCNTVQLATQPRLAMLTYARYALVQESGLHSLEAQVVVDMAGRLLERAGFRGVSGPIQGFAGVEATLQGDWDKLQRRYHRILATCR
ncbi:hypothetical protein KOL96_10270 [Ralstonia wenshanensis]|uniref:hypothetical protein n=1 Tax=Ralstonia wenshanensis TaxID=2842456 RepID=UPI001E3DB2CE|nr:hypothetical protein [Ralstonia wenshanensis]UGS91492.1 hypothetical protein KOL96_10270 [Ralstonia wenshanensis]